MRKIVCNTTPLISFLKIDKLDLLQRLYGEIIIPTGVYQEMETGKNKVYYMDLKKLNWIKIEGIQDRGALNYFLELDAGEAEVIVLAMKFKLIW